MGFTASASKATGQGAGNSTTYTNSQVAGNTVTIESGGNTNLKGAVVKGNQVKADVGGNLNIAILQDSSQYKGKSQQLGGSVTFGPTPGGSLNVGQTKINSDYKSVNKQSAIRAGDGGFQVNVQSKTELIGGQITSTQAAVDQNKNSYEAKQGTTTTDLQNNANFKAKGVSVGIGAGAPSPGAALSSSMSGAGFGKDGGSAQSTTTAGISGVAGNTAARTGDRSTSIAPIFDKEKVQKEVAAQVAITSEFGKQASKIGGTEADKQRDDLKSQAKQAQGSGNSEKAQALLAEAAKWDEGGAYRVAMHTVIGGLSGGTAGAVGAGAASLAAPTLNELQSQLETGLKKVGLGDSASKVIAGLASGATAAGIGAAASGGSVAGAATAFNTDMNNRQLHPNEYKRARDMANSKQIRDALSKQEGREITAAELEGRIAAEMLRNSDATANAQSGGVHDYSLRAIVGCQQLNCNASQSDPNYNNTNYNAQFIAPNQSTYDKGQSQLKTGVTYDQLVTKNVKNNPVGTGIAGVGLVGLGVATGGATTVGTRVLAGGIGSTFNAIYQSTQSQPIDWLDVGIAGLTGFVAGGGSLAQGLTSSLGVNTGGALLGSTIKGENPNGAVVGAAAGTVVGYGLGKGVESVVKIKTDPWYRRDWVDTGAFGVQRWNPPSAVPTVSGNSTSSLVQESFGDPIKNYINKKQRN